jgi:outer membrane protein assembly factor BamB
VALGGGGVYALGARGGEVRWKLPGLHATALIGEGARLYVATHGGAVTALQAATGQTLWSTQVGPVTSGLSLLSGWLWMGLAGNRLLAVDPANGAEQWRTTLPAPLVAQPAPYRDMVLVPTAGQEGLLVGLRPPDSEPVFRYRADSPLRATPLVRGDVVLLPAADGRVLGLRVKADAR